MVTKPTSLKPSAVDRAFGIVGDLDDAEDVFMEGITQLLRRGRVPPDRKRFRVLLPLIQLVAAPSCGSPVEPDELQYMALVVGGFHACALSTSGETFCWGHNPSQRFGGPALGLTEDTTGDRTHPRRVQGDPGFSVLSAGENFTCGLTKAGRAYCWGSNEAGQLGVDTLGGERFHAEPVNTDLRFDRLLSSAGAGHMCGLAERRAYCWGNNFRKELGAGLDDIHVPHVSPVVGDHTFVSVAAGPGESCALTSGSDVYCWGADSSGLNDESSVTDRNAPVLIAEGTAFHAIGVGSSVLCGLRGSDVLCRGWNAHGVLGTGDTVSSAEFQRVESSGVGFAKLAVGRVHACALTDEGIAYCWGAGTRGRLGNGSDADMLRPTPVAGGHRFQDIAAGGNHTCAITPEGEVYCWGPGSFGQLGNGSRDDSLVPVKIAEPVT